MNFSSFEYILCFLPAVLVLVEVCRRIGPGKSPQICVLLASLLFYSQARPVNLIYLLASILANWQVAQQMVGLKGIQRKRMLQIGLILNICFLGCIKYLGFLVSNLSPILPVHISAPSIAFPLGVSFFTIAQIMYLVDCYEELVTPMGIFDHATFVAFFPYVISGPISRAKKIAHQFARLNSRQSPSADVIARACLLFSIGLLKKVVFADAFAFTADYAFSGNIGHLSMFEAWMLISAYGFQLYFDFSGYSDMAVASALLLGVELPRNFDAPFRSTSIIEFWRRWHITLSDFITTYLYTPILRSFERINLATAAIATILAMTIAGLWHGPSWTFVIFGLIHGIGLAVNQFWKKKRMPSIPKPLCWILTFALLDLGFVFFRAPNLPSAIAYASRLISWHDPFGVSTFRDMAVAGLMAALYMASQVIGTVAALSGKTSDDLARDFSPTVATCALTVTCTLLSVLYLNSNTAKPFVYFAF